MNLQNFSFFLADQFLKGTAVLAVASLVSFLFRRASAAKRNAIWFSAFAVLLLLPLTHFARPQWTWGPAARTVAPTATLPPIVITPIEANFAELPAAAVPAISRETSLRLPDWKALLIVLWGLGVAFLLLRRAIASVQLHRLFRRSSVAQADFLHRLLSRMIRLYALARPVRMRVSPLCHVPVTWGMIRPVILLPHDAEKWPENRAGIVLAHEFGHIRRWDAAARMLTHFACAIHWFNPLVWVAARQLRLVQEHACDDLVLSHGTDPAEYAMELVESVRRFQLLPSAFRQALAMAQPSTLETRVGAIMDTRRDRSSAGAWPIAVSACTVILTLLVSTVAQVSDAGRGQAIGTGNNPSVSQINSDNATHGAVDAGPESPRPSKTPDGTPLIQKVWVVPDLHLWPDVENAWRSDKQPRRRDAVPLLKEKGVSFPENSSAFHLTDLSQNPPFRLVVNNTQENLDRVDKIIKVVVNNQLILKEWSLPTMMAEKLVPGGQLPQDENGRVQIKEVLQLIGVTFPESTYALYSAEKGRLLVRNNQANLDWADKVISEAFAGLSDLEREALETLAIAQQSKEPGFAIQQKAQRLIIPKLEWLELTTVQAAVDFLVRTAREIDPEKKGVEIAFAPNSANPTPSPGGNPNERRITPISLTNIPLSEALRYITGLVDLKVEYNERGIIILPQTAPAPVPSVSPSDAK
ncbi:M56 family metallopeptidase [Verrucomicrobiota bacterium sgz303538]